MNSVGVEILIVLTWLQGSVLLGHEEKQRGLWGLRGQNASRFQVFIDECSAGFLLHWVERVYFSDFWDEGILEFDGMVEKVMWGKYVVGLFREDIGKGRTEVGDRDVLWFVSLGELSRDGDLIDVFICSPCQR